ncbi:hypothetical protein EFL26_15720 [Nocardioides pocheonensis]|uniref:LamG domain-containing protein n=1 Tax=Nocardioides pocheonensis TaxID=661485 RepID=A0A3N0GLA8_9ACTN|nr:hypothetical protein EFL26_15720 [Nocardioides pocheonensis]
MARHRRGRHRPVRTVLLAALSTLALLALGTAGTRSAWTAAQVTNASDDALVSQMALTHSYNSTTCATTARSTTATCPSTLGTVASPTTTRTDAITNNGTVAVTQSVTGASCAPVRFANGTSASDPMLPRNSVGFQQADTWGSTSAASFSGSGYATDLYGTTSVGFLGLLPTNFSMGVWFRTADSLGGGLLSLSASLSNGAGGANPMLWIDQSGNVKAYVATTLGTQIASSGTNYADGNWHFAVVVVSTVFLLTSVTLYVDGASKASAGGLTIASATSGYWHLGWANFGLITPPTSAYFHGSLSGAFVIQSAISGANVTTLNGSASAAAYQASLGGMSPASTWMLGDNGYTTIAGTSLPAGNLYDPCSKVNVALAFTNPAASIAAQSLTSFANGSATTIAAPAVGGTQSLTITTSAGTGYNADLAGLHLYVPISFGYAVSGAPAWVQTLSWANDPTEVFWS